MRRIITILLILTVLMCCCTSCGVVVPPSEGESELQETVSAAVPTEEEEGMILLSVIESEPLFSGGSSDPFVKTLQATVLPSTAYDKYVTWSIAWSADATCTDPVTDYVTVVPTEAGSTTATVTCLKAFPDDTAVITVRTRVGGWKASCTVSYYGAPETIAIDTERLAFNANAVDGDKYIFYGFEETGTMPNWIPILMDNRFGYVGDAYLNDFDLTVKMHGQIYANCETVEIGDGDSYIRHADAVASEAFIEDNYVCVTFEMPDRMYFNSTTGFLEPVEDLTLHLFKLEYSRDWESHSGGLLVGIHSLNDIFVFDDDFHVGNENGFYSALLSGSPGTPSDYSSVYFTFTYTHKATGLSTSFDIVLAEWPSSVSLNESDITF